MALEVGAKFAAFNVVKSELYPLLEVTEHGYHSWEGQRQVLSGNLVQGNGCAAY